MILLDIDPNVVKPGWTPLIITVALAAVIVLLYFSMRRQVRRINVAGSTPLAAADVITADEAVVDETPESDAAEPEKSVDATAATGPNTSSTPAG